MGKRKVTDSVTCHKTIAEVNRLWGDGREDNLKMFRYCVQLDPYIGKTNYNSFYTLRFCYERFKRLVKSATTPTSTARNIESTYLLPERHLLS